MPAYICTSDFPQRIGTGARYTFYLTIPGKGYWDGQKYKCVIKGDNTEAYTLLETLRHGSIVVKDSQQRCAIRSVPEAIRNISAMRRLTQEEEGIIG